MKLITVQFADSVDTDVLAAGTTGISVSNGTATLSNGVVLAKSEVYEAAAPNPVLVPHTHPVIGGTGAAQPT